MTDSTAAFLERIAEGELVETEFTLDEFLEHNPEEPPYLEYEGKGRVRRKMSPTTDHAAIAGWLSYAFHTYRERAGRRLYVYVELRTNVADLSKVPDVAIYVDQRPRENQRKQALVVADLSIEIVSPRQSREQQEAKCQWYPEQGGRFAMLIDPQRRDVTIYSKALGSNTMGTLGRYFEHAPDTATIGELDELMPGLDLTGEAIFKVLDG